MMMSSLTSWWPGPGEFALPELSGIMAKAASPVKVLLVVAHPDDESECAATIYRITHEVGGVVDQLVVTDGAGGLSFSAPALDYYGLRRSRVTGKELSRLRRGELLRAGKIIGIRHHYFLDQKDSGFTLDVDEGLRTWDLPRVRGELSSLLERERYDVVLTLLPTSDTHGHHKTVALLALEAVQAFPDSSRPVLMGVSTGSFEKAGAAFEELPGFPETRTTNGQPVWSFDRRTPLSLSAALDHSIIVNWVIAEHKSQGMFQMEYGRHTHEHFWQFAAGGERREAVWRPLLRHFAADSLLTPAVAA